MHSQPANVIRLKPFFRQFKLVPMPVPFSHSRTVRLSVSADIRLREGAHKLCSRQLTVNRPTAKAAKQPSNQAGYGQGAQQVGSDRQTY